MRYATAPGLKTALFDMDDTLIDCGPYYRDTILKGGTFISARTGMSVNQVVKLIGELDLGAVSIDQNFQRDRFPRSFLAASIAADLVAGQDPDYSAAREAYAIGDSVFHAEYAFREGAVEMLRELLQQDYRLVLVTKGDPWVQERKITKRRLRDYFSSVHIVPSKGTTVLSEILHAERVDIERSFMVGDSLKDDIAPALANGLAAIHIAPADQWSYNLADVTPTATILELPELLEVVTRLAVASDLGTAYHQTAG